MFQYFRKALTPQKKTVRRKQRFFIFPCSRTLIPSAITSATQWHTGCNWGVYTETWWSNNYIKGHCHSRSCKIYKFNKYLVTYTFHGRSIQNKSPAVKNPLCSLILSGLCLSPSLTSVNHWLSLSSQFCLSQDTLWWPSQTVLLCIVMSAGSPPYLSCLLGHFSSTKYYHTSGCTTVY